MDEIEEEKQIKNKIERKKDIKYEERIEVLTKSLSIILKEEKVFIVIIYKKLI